MIAVLAVLALLAWASGQRGERSARFARRMIPKWITVGVVWMVLAVGMLGTLDLLASSIILVITCAIAFFLSAAVGLIFYIAGRVGASKEKLA